MNRGDSAKEVSDLGGRHLWAWRGGPIIVIVTNSLVKQEQEAARCRGSLMPIKLIYLPFFKSTWVTPSTLYLWSASCIMSVVHLPHP